MELKNLTPKTSEWKDYDLYRIHVKANDKTSFSDMQFTRKEALEFFDIFDNLCKNTCGDTGIEIKFENTDAISRNNSKSLAMEENDTLLGKIQMYLFAPTEYYDDQDKDDKSLSKDLLKSDFQEIYNRSQIIAETVHRLHDKSDECNKIESSVHVRIYSILGIIKENIDKLFISFYDFKYEELITKYVEFATILRTIESIVDGLEDK